VPLNYKQKGNKMKTFKEWATAKGIWDKYLKNISISLDNLRKIEPIVYTRGAFRWKKSNEGFDYWRDIHIQWKAYADKYDVTFD